MLPLQPPEAVHDVAFVEAHVSVDAPPEDTADGLALSVTVGAGTTTTDALFWAVPPSPVQVIVNVVFVFSVPVDRVPIFSAMSPLQPPEATHDVTSVAVHARVAAPPTATVDGFATRLTVGGGVVCATVALILTLACTWPPEPEQLNVKVLVEASGPVL
jgi:hypothetical protein